MPDAVRGNAGGAAGPDPVGFLDDPGGVLRVNHIDQLIVEFFPDFLRGKAQQLFHAVGDIQQLIAVIQGGTVVSAGQIIIDILQFGDILAGSVEQVAPFFRAPQEINVNLHPEKTHIRFIDPEMPPGAVDPVVFRVFQHHDKRFPVLRIEILQNPGTPAFQLLDRQADHMEEGLVIPDDIHVVIPETVEGDRPQNIVQHGVRINIPVQEFPDPQGIVPVERDPVIVCLAGIRQNGFETLGRHGAVKIEALHIPDIHIREILHQLRRLHALHDQGRSQGFGHIDDRLENADAFELISHGKVQELRVQLDNIHVHAAQHVQRGIAAAEIVHEDGEAFFAQLRHGRPDPVRIIHIRGFGDFHLQNLFRQLIFFHQAPQGGGNVDDEKVDPGNVDGNRHGPDPAVNQMADPFADGFPDEKIQISDDAVFLQNRNKDRRRHIGAVASPPPGQGFHSDHGTVRHIDLRLNKELDFSGFQGGVEVRQDPEFLQMTLVGFRLVDPDMGLQVILDLLRGQGCPVKQLQSVMTRFIDEADAQHGEEAAAGGKGFNRLAQLREQAVNRAFVKGNQQTEIVLAAIAGDAVFALRQGLQNLREADQQSISVLLAV